MSAEDRRKRFEDTTVEMFETVVHRVDVVHRSQTDQGDKLDQAISLLESISESTKKAAENFKLFAQKVNDRMVSDGRKIVSLEGRANRFEKQMEDVQGRLKTIEGST